MPRESSFQLRGGCEEAVLRAEARLCFGNLAADRSNLPMLLDHDPDSLVAEQNDPLHRCPSLGGGTSAWWP